MDSSKEEEGPGRTPAKGVPSILYFIDNIPGNPENLKFEVISHFQKRKRFNGGEVVEKEYQALGPNSALLLFESAEEVSGLQDVEHYIRDQKLKLRPLVKELVTLKLGRSSFIQELVSSEQVAKLIKGEELVLTKGKDDCTIQVSGNWISVEQFRQKFQQFMITELKKHSIEGFSGETTESSVDPKSKAIEDAPPDGVSSAKGSSLNPDVLALMQKTGTYQNSALSYDLQTATINVNCDDPTEKERIKEEFYTAYQELMMGGKLKEHTFPVDDVQQANAIVGEYSKTFSHTYFRYDPEKKEIKCLSTDARQMQNVRRRLSSMKKTPEAKSVHIDLPRLLRRVTIKLGDITEEEVDIIVNAANDRLMHGGGVAAAIDRASYGAVQQESSKLIEQTGTLPTGGTVVTNAGGKLRCKFVIHAVGPIAYQHKDQCGALLHTVCVNSMIIAQRNKAKSISFPPISSGIFGVSKELVANVMLSSLCSYPCSDPELLNDVRIVIIDEPTFDVFFKLFNKEKENLKLLQNAISTENSSMATTTSHYGMQLENAPQLGPHNNLGNLVSIDLPNLSRRVILKFGDIVEEEVDAIVNSANMHLLHNTGMAAAINKASGGVVQAESTKMTYTGNIIPTGKAVATIAGGALKCKLVVHAVGPVADQHKNQCALLLKNACISAMNVAANFEAYSIAFPPISSGNCGVPTDLVADIMISTLCSYPCSNPTLLSDVRIVIIDRLTFDVFLRIFHGYQQSIQQVHSNATTASTTTTAASVIKPSTFQYYYSPGASPVTDGTTKFPGRAQPVSHSQAVTQQPQAAREITYPTNIFDAQPTNPSSPSSQNHGDTTLGIPSFDSKEVPDSSPIANKPKHDPDDIQDNINNPTHVQGDDSSNATSNDTKTDDKTSSKHKFSIKGVKDGDIKGDKHSEDTSIDSFKKPDNGQNKDKTVSNHNAPTDENGENEKETVLNDNAATNENGINKEETVSNEFAATNKSSGYDSSVDAVSTNPDLKPTTNNTNPSLQPVSIDPLNPSDKHEEISGEQDSPSPEPSQDNTGSKPKQKSGHVTLYSKHLPPTLAAGNKQTSLQKEQNSEIKDKSKEKKNDSSEKSEACPICFDKVKDKPPTAVTTCKHCKQVFCKRCLDEALKHKPYCPTCTLPLRKITGNQPTGGTMTVHTYPKQKLPGYGQCGTIQIHYDIPSGKQGKEHPNPGQYFHGTVRTAYVPDSPEGRKVVRLLKKAFDARLIFTVGTSHTSGATNAIVWNDIHHKTSMSGGPTNYGYPDPTYLSRVLEELAAKGIKE